MPIQFDLEAIRKEHQCEVYLETGLYDPRLEVSARKALACSFDKVYSMEIRKDWIDIAHQLWGEEVKKGRLHLIHGDSVKLHQYLQSPDFERKTLFFLDAHVDNEKITDFTLKCPLLEELKAIKQLVRKDHVILIDDLRYVSQSFPWGEASYGDINFLRHIMNMISDINPNYQFKTLDGVIKDDVLMCYV